MRLNPAAFNGHLAFIGQRYSWRKAFHCPCVDPYSGAATPGCPQCGGKGRLWDPPVQGVAGVASQKVQQAWAQFGMWQDGDTVLSIPENTPLYEMGQFDRVTMLNATEDFSLVLVRGAPVEKLFFNVNSIFRVFWLDANKNVVQGAIPTVAADGSLSWTSGAPPLGVQYSVSGKRYSEYFCFGQFPGMRGEHQGARLPKRVVLRSFDLFGRDMTSTT
jgi:hypothetical protein